MNKKVKALGLAGIISIQIGAHRTDIFAGDMSLINVNKQEIKVKSNKVKNTKGIVVEIPDYNLKSTLNEFLGQSKNSDITKEQLNGLTGTLDLFSREIKNIEGLQYCTSIKELNLSWNEISDIRVLSELKNLKSLNLEYNEIKDISILSELKELENLCLFYNKISDISALSGLNDLKILMLSGNKISEISSLSGLKNLKYLDLHENKISDINALSKLKSLELLEIDGNKISKIDALSGLKNLKSLYLFENRISDISVLSGLKNLEYLYLSGNKISDISPLSKLTKLRDFSVSDQNIELSKIITSSENNIKIKNNIKDENNKVTPVTISSNKGKYNSSSKQIELNKVKSNSAVVWKFNRNIKINGQQGVFSGTVNQPITIVKVDAPVVKVTKESYNSYKISWNRVSGANGYVVYRSTSKDGEYKKIKTVKSGKTTSYTNTKLTTGKMYYYKIKTYKTISNKNIYSSYSKVVSVKPTSSNKKQV